MTDPTPGIAGRARVTKAIVGENTSPLTRRLLNNNVRRQWCAA